MAETKHGGARPGAGRPAGSTNRKTIELQQKIAESGETPLEYMIKVMRRPYPPKANIAQKIAIDEMRMDAAKAAAPYVHARLSSVELSGKNGDPIEITQITRRIVKA